VSVFIGNMTQSKGLAESDSSSYPEMRDLVSVQHCSNARLTSSSNSSIQDKISFSAQFLMTCYELSKT
jgi:hypothetical protein